MKNLRVNLLIPYDYYEGIKAYCRKKVSFLETRTFTRHIGNEIVELEISESTYSSYSSYSFIDLAFTIKKSGKTFFQTQISVDRVSHLCKIFMIENYLIKIDKDVPNTLEFAKSKLNIMKCNKDDDDYVWKMISFNSFDDDIELMQSIYLFLSNGNCLYGKEMEELMRDKLSYYDLDNEPITDITKTPLTDSMFDGITSEKIKDIFLGVLLYELKFHIQSEDLIEFLISWSYIAYLTYITRLDEEGYFSRTAI